MGFSMRGPCEARIPASVSLDSRSRSTQHASSWGSDKPALQFQQRPEVSLIWLTSDCQPTQSRSRKSARSLPFAQPDVELTAVSQQIPAGWSGRRRQSNSPTAIIGVSVSCAAVAIAARASAMNRSLSSILVRGTVLMLLAGAASRGDVDESSDGFRTTTRGSACVHALMQVSLRCATA